MIFLYFKLEDIYIPMRMHMRPSLLQACRLPVQFTHMQILENWVSVTYIIN